MPTPLLMPSLFIGLVLHALLFRHAMSHRSASRRPIFASGGLQPILRGEPSPS